jgi:hypothetical protein
MKIQVDKSRTIADLQQEFNACYPYLKLVFFTKSHKAYKNSPAKFLIHDNNTKLEALEGNPHDGVLYLEEDMPTWQVERLFEETFGLHVQVFRKCGNTWLETTISDDMNLEEQNVKGKTSENKQFEFVDPLDYRETR